MIYFYIKFTNRKKRYKMGMKNSEYFLGGLRNSKASCENIR